MASKRKIETNNNATEKPKPMWMVWSSEHHAWWGPNGCGYRNFKQQAGRYSFSEALEIVRDANRCAKGIPMETMCPEF